MKDQKEREAKDFTKTIAALQNKLAQERDRANQLEKKAKQDREVFANKIQNLNSSIELKSLEPNGNQSSKAKSKLSTSMAYQKSLSGSKTSTAENKLPANAY